MTFGVIFIPDMLITLLASRKKHILRFFAEFHSGSHRKSKNVKSSGYRVALTRLTSLFQSLEIAKAKIRSLGDISAVSS